MYLCDGDQTCTSIDTCLVICLVFTLPQESPQIRWREFKKLVVGLKERKRWDKTMQIWVWQTGEGAAVRLLEDRFQLGAWTWLVSSCTLSDASNWCPQTTLVLSGPSNSTAWMSAPMCMCDCWLWSAQQIVYSSKASFGAVDLLLPYWSLVLWYFILFSFSFLRNPQTWYFKHSSKLC